MPATRDLPTATDCEHGLLLLFQPDLHRALRFHHESVGEQLQLFGARIPQGLETFEVVMHPAHPRGGTPAPIRKIIALARCMRPLVTIKSKRNPQLWRRKPRITVYMLRSAPKKRYRTRYRTRTWQWRCPLGGTRIKRPIGAAVLIHHMCR